MVPSQIGDTYFLRFAVCAASTEEKHVEFAWKVVTETADILSPE